MLDYSLAPDPNRMDTDSCYQQQFEAYPESKEWVDCLRGIDALRDTFLTMPTGERHHAFFVDRGSSRTAIVVHGWRDCAIKFFWLARIYEHELGYNVVMPELHGCGESEGEAIQMGWKDRLDVMQWMKTFQADTMVVHGVSMGAATTMMLSGEQMPEGINDLRFVEDCGYTCVWDEFAGQLKEQFGLPEFPLMHSTSLLCRLRYGWSFDEASALKQVSKCHYPMLFIHGDADTGQRALQILTDGLVALRRVVEVGQRGEAADHAGGLVVRIVLLENLHGLLEVGGEGILAGVIVAGAVATAGVLHEVGAVGLADALAHEGARGDLVGLGDKQDRYPDELSGGEQQRVAIARALVNNPSTIIADEPTGNLDPDRSLEIMTLLEMINALGTTLLVVTHEKALVNHFNKRVIHIMDGVVVSDEEEGYYIHES